jgi:hypothetical protein
VPAGWYSNPQLLVGTTNSNGVVVYAFRTPGVQAGQTYLSTVNFMVSTGGDNNVASGGIWQNSRVNPTLPAECGLDVARSRSAWAGRHRAGAIRRA